jgi:purine-binding chemotaxis protein CheW
MTLQLATFFVGADRLALDLMRLREIVRPLPITPVPQAPQGMVGVVELRGEILPMFDLRVCFGLPARVGGVEDVRHLMVRLDGRSLGLVVDGMDEVVNVERTQVRSGVDLFAIAGGATKAQQFFVGVVQLPRGLALLLNLRQLVGAVDMEAAGILPIAVGER